MASHFLTPLRLLSALKRRLTGEDSDTNFVNLRTTADSAFNDLADHKQDFTNGHQVSKAQVGLEFADNTADIDKPVSIAQQAALDLKADKNAVSSSLTETTSALLGNVGTDADTLEKLNNKILGLAQILASDDVNLDTAREWVSAIKSDEGLIASLTSTKADKDQVTLALNNAVSSLLDSVDEAGNTLGKLYALLVSLTQAYSAHQHTLSIGNGVTEQMTLATNECLSIVQGQNVQVLFDNTTKTITIKSTNTFTGNADSASKLATVRTFSFTGDAQGSGSFDGTGNVAIAMTLPNSNSTPGTFGSTTKIPVIQVDAKGRTLHVSEADVFIPNGAVQLTGDGYASGQTGTPIAFTLTSINAGGTGTKVTYDSKGRVISSTSLDSNDVINALGFIPENHANKTPDFTTVNDTLFPTVKAVKTYVDQAVIGVVLDCGNWDASTGLWPSTGGTGIAGAIKKGNFWYVNVAGSIGGIQFGIGDSFRALVDAPGQDATNWASLEGNIGFVPENSTKRDYSGGYAGLTQYKLNLKNTTGTVTSFLTNNNTVARTYTFPDKDGTVAMMADVVVETQTTLLQKLGATAVTGNNSGDETTATIVGKLNVILDMGELP